MRIALQRFSLASLLLATAGSLALAAPLRVRTAGGEAQTVIMCPDCDQPIACARAGDYTVAFSANLESTRSGITQFLVRLTDRTGSPVSNLRVTIVLSMPGHGHRPRTVSTSGRRGGRYVASTVTRMEGTWRADVRITSPKGDVVTQPFTFLR